MKTKITLSALSFIICNLTSWAQPIVTGAIQSPIGTKTFGYVIPGTIVHGSTGAAQTWDYSAIVHDTSTYYFENIDFASLSAPVQALFPTGNAASAYVLGGSVVAKLVFHLDATQFLYLGLNSSVFPVPVTYFTFPHNYLETNVAGLTYDAYGTLTTPFGTWNDVVRMRGISGGNYKYDYYQFDPTYVLLMEYYVDTVTLAVSNPAFYNTASIAGIDDDANANDHVNIYPNPSTGKFLIEPLEITEGAYLEVFNALGEKMFQQQTISGLDLSNYPKGIYYVKIHNGIKSVTEKILVQ